MKMVTAAALLMLAAAPALAKDEKPPYVYGPEPTWDQFRAIAEAGIQERLVDPESARISWTMGFFKGAFRPFLEKKYFGYVACGTVNAKNRMGGYTGASGFVVVIDNDRVLYAAIERTPGGLVEAPCAKMTRDGLFPPLPPGAVTTSGTAAAGATSSPAASEIASKASGLTLRAMPEGAYVSAVAPGSPAAIAGMTPGMVVTTVNGIPIGDMGGAMLKVIDAAGADASLGLVGGKAIKLGAPR